MERLCDIYIDGAHAVPELRFVKIFDKSFSYVEGKIYSGYIGATLPRIKGVLIVSRLKAAGIRAFNVPLVYRDANISKETAHGIALKDIEGLGLQLSLGDNFRDIHTPMYWCFSITDPKGDLLGARVLVDKVDGHVWSTLEYDEFMYDYNNVLN